MPMRLLHHAPDFGDEDLIRLVLKEIRHGIDEDALRLLPAEWRGKRGLVVVHAPGPNVALAGFARGAGVFLHAHGLQARRHAHGVAIGAAGREHLAASDRIPRRLGPFDVGCGQDILYPLEQLTLSGQIAYLVPKALREIAATDKY